MSAKNRLKGLAVGTALSFTTCSIAGHFVPENLDGFTRFHVFVSPDTLYYPTVRSVWNMARERVDRSKTNVIVGGSSVLYGTGQPPGKTFAEFLADDLGAHYTVLNLAMRGGDVAGMALFIAEALKAEGYRIVYLADAFDGATDPIGGNPYFKYIYWQYRTESFSSDWAPRTQYSRASAWGETAVGQRLNSIFRFDNLWYYFSYYWFSTVASALLPEGFWRPRHSYADPEFEWPPGAIYARMEVAPQVNMLNLMAQPLSEAQWQVTETGWRDTVPDSLKTTTFLVFCAKSPHYIALMDPARAHLLANLYTEATTRASADGLNGIEPCRDFDEDDYVDPTHLSVSGADKLAHAMALAIKQLNEQP